VPWERDVGAYDERASRYEEGWQAGMHRQIVARTIGVALRLQPTPRRVLDIGCGTGLLLREIARQIPGGAELVGIDPAPRMVEVARSSNASEADPEFLDGSVEELPFEDRHFDLVVSTTSFDHWEDQQRGLKECARVLSASGHFVCVDQFSYLLWPTMLHGRRGKARTKPRAERLLRAAGLRNVDWHDIYAVIIKGFSATL
jgi:ubiquinone/menaquinone biosynthesis C-methylase UbiE